MKRTAKYFMTGFALIIALLVVGCGNDSGPSAGTSHGDKTTGDISLALVWKTPANIKTDMARSAQEPAFNEDGTIDCDQSAISTIYVKIYDQAGGTLLTDNGAGWNCSDHSGTVQNVPASKDGGDYRQLICLARDEQGNVIYGGEQTDIHLIPNNTVQVRIEMGPLDTGHITAPTVIETSPADNAVNMSQTTTIRARFSKPINKDTLTASSFVVSDGHSEIAGNITYNATTATFSPTVPFATDTPYTVTLTTDIQDLFGIPLQADFTWSFTTMETVPPKVEKTYPLDSARGVQVFPTITAAFDEPMTAGTLNPETFLASDGTKKIEGTVSYDDATKTAAFIPGDNLSCDTTYTITVTTGAKDALGNAMAADKTWHFKTANHCGGEVIADGASTMALKSDGSLWAWGYNYYGQLGDGTNARKNSPFQIGTDADWATVAIQTYHAVAIKTDGSLWSWGNNESGQLGDGTDENKNSPTQVGTDLNWAAISAGGNHTVALKTDGSLWAWGGNKQGQLGDGTKDNKLIPIQIGEDFDWTVISAGINQTVALKANGSLWTWGYNNDEKDIIPVQIGTDHDWVAVAAGSANIVALKSDGSLWSWGKDSGWAWPTQIGSDNDWRTITTGAALKIDGSLWAIGPSGVTRIGTDTDWAAVSTNGHFVALKIDGSLWVWGNNDQGQLGDGTYSNKDTPIQITATANWTMVSNFLTHTTAVKSDGTLWAWGENFNGQLGDGTFGDKNTPVQIGAGTDWKMVAAGSCECPAYERGDTIALKTNGSLWGWGSNFHGQVGAKNNTPTQIGADTDWDVISIGAYHAVGLGTDGSLWGWGKNNFDGELGDKIDSPTLIGADTDWSAVDTGVFHTIALKTDGSLWAWGSNGSGQLGDGTNEDKYTHIRVGADSDWKSISAGNFHTMALKTDGSLWAWGDNEDGQLGDGTAVDKNIPVQIGTDTDWAVVSAGAHHTIALKSDGSLWAWGDNGSGQLGDGTAVDKNTPTQIGADSHWVAVSAGGYVTFAQKTNGTLWAWGINNRGELGDGSETFQQYSPSPVDPFTIH